MPNPGLAYKIAELLGSTTLPSFPASAAPADNVAPFSVLRDAWDVLRNGTGGAEPATNKSIMDYVGVSSDFFNPRLGFGVTKVSSLADGSGTDNLFTVTGRVLITSLTGEVTTVVATTTTMKLRDTTNSVDLCAATTITSDAVGTMYALTSINTNILNGTGATPVIGSIPNITGAQLIDVAVVGHVQSAITLAHVLDGAGTGAVTWRLTYIPLVSGATVTAAA